MDRSGAQCAGSTEKSPHARGDGPSGATQMTEAFEESPRTWGWTAGHESRTRCKHRVPTHVGMDRRGNALRALTMESPHARGDGPSLYDKMRAEPAESPRTWGWTVCVVALSGSGARVPTHVGMDRLAMTLSTVFPSESPRTWGWTAFALQHGTQCLQSPHARGDGPWQHEARELGYNRVPTHVGMDRSSWHPTWPGQQSPHARGDGPTSAKQQRSTAAESPRTWGWTVHNTHGCCADGRVPTHVGMDR